MQHRNFLFWSLNIFIPLIIGFFVYVFFCPDTYISILFFKFYPLHPINDSFENFFHSPFQILIRSYLCDSLWAYALLFSVSLLLRQSKNNLLISIIVCASFESIIEFLQMFPNIPGTFDLYDILIEIMTTIFAAMVIKIHNKKYREVPKNANT